MLLAVDALAHVHRFSAPLAPVDWRVAGYAAGCGVGVGVGVLVDGQFMRGVVEERVAGESNILCSLAYPGSTAIALLASSCKRGCASSDAPPPRRESGGNWGSRLLRTS